jgi:hypothetical protein
MSDGNIFKPEKDFTKEADKVIPEAQEIAKVGITLFWTCRFAHFAPDRYPERHRQDIRIGEASQTGKAIPYKSPYASFD